MLVNEYSWEEFNNHASKLKNRIKSSGKKFDCVVGITRGGLPLATALGYGLGIKDVTTITPEDLPAYSSRLVGKNILLVDDISETGKTFVMVSSHLLNHDNKVTTASIHCVSDTTIFIPDFYAEDNAGKDYWINYPWEVV